MRKKEASFTHQGDEDIVSWRHPSVEQHISHGKATFQIIALCLKGAEEMLSEALSDRLHQ